MKKQSIAMFRVWGSDSVAYGPFDLAALSAWVRQGRVSRNTWVYSEEQGEWTRAGDVAELAKCFQIGSESAPVANPPSIPVDLLRRIGLFSGIEERQLVSFLPYMEVVSLPPQAPVFKEGEHGDAMFMVLKGEVRARVVVSGRESTLSTMGVGECFGEVAVIDEGPRSADVISTQPSVLLKFSAAGLNRLCQEAPALAAPLLRALSKTITTRVRKLTKRHEDSLVFARSFRT
jgi:hypothetical protein